MKVLHLIPTLGGGGAERQLAYLATSLARRGTRIHVGYVLTGHHASLLEGRIDGLHCIPARSNYDPAIVGRIVALIRSLGIDIVQTWLPQMDVLGGIAAIRCGVPWVLSERSSPHQYRPTWKILVRKWIGARAAAVVANSDSGLSYWRRAARFADNDCVIRNTVPVADIRALRIPDEIENFEPDSALIVAAGRLIESKNLEVLLRAVDHVHLQTPAAMLLLFGAGPLEGELKAIIGGMRRPERVRVMGYTDSLWAWLKRAQVYVSLSRYEGNPNSVLEAVACGCPTILSDIAAHREVLAESETCFVPLDDPLMVARQIEHVLARRDCALKRATSASQRIEKFDAAKATDAYLEIYEQLVARTARRQRSS